MIDLAIEVADVMTPGVVAISEERALEDAVGAMAEHRLHAILVVGARSGTPLGWVNTRGLLGLAGADPATPVVEAITERVTGIERSATLRAALYALALPGVTRLLVRDRDGGEPAGVISDYDLTVKAFGLSRHPA